MIDGEQLHQARVRAKLTQEQLAAAVGVTLRSVGNWERGAGVPRNREALVRDALGSHLVDPPTASNPLAVASDMALLAELGRRLARGGTDEGQQPEAQKMTDDAPRPSEAEVLQLRAADKRHDSRYDQYRASLDAIEDQGDPGD